MSDKKTQEERKPKKFILNLTDKECDNFCLMAAKKGVSLEEILEDFIGNLATESEKQESIETRRASHAANEYFDRAYYAYQDKDATFLRWLVNVGKYNDVISELKRLASTNASLDFERIKEAQLEILYQRYQAEERNKADKEYIEELMDIWNFEKWRDSFRAEGSQPN